jgi:hypothetical protein
MVPLPPAPSSPPPPSKPSKAILKKSTLLSSGSPSIYKITTKTVSTVNMKANVKIEKCVFGKQPSIPKPTRVFMVVGATGAGKSTLINGMVNYALGVEWKDDFRFKLITDEVAQSQAHSQTQNITSYTLYWQEGSPLNYNLTIVDTPGFGDTRGVQRDKQITALIKEFFELKGDKGIDQIHGIGFITQSALARLTPTQRYVFDSVLSVFGNDIRDNIFIMATFADGTEPAVKGAVKEADIPFCNFLSFNNAFLFESNDDDANMNESFWKMGYKNFEKFFLDFDTKQPVSLQLTRDVLKERQNLETTIEGLQKRIAAGLAKINELNQEEDILRRHEDDIESHKNFVEKVKVPKHKRVDISGQQWYVTNCNVCNFTCHDKCIYNNDGDKYLCAAMDGKGQANAKCTACPGKCHWQSHANNAFYYELYEEEETRTLEDIQKKYNLAKEKKSDVQKVVKQMEAYLESLHQQVLRDIREVRNCLERLNKIALKPNPLTDTEYIDLIIQSEKSEKKLGYDQRIEYLLKIKQQAQFMANLTDQELDKKVKEGAKSWWQQFQRR